MDLRPDLPNSRIQHHGCWKLRCCALVAGLMVVCGSVPAQTSIPTEYQVKAAFLYNFAKFFEWPPAAMSQNGQAFTICVHGSHAVAQQLQPMLGGKSVDAHPVRVRQVHGAEEMHGCQIVFIAATAMPQAARYLANLAEISVLTVGEAPGFCVRGGIVNFWMEADHIRFEINPTAAERAHLHASSKLLRLARIVDEAGNNEGGH